MKKTIFTILLVAINSFHLFAQSPTPTVIQMQSSGKDVFDYILFGIQFLTLIGLILYVYKTWEIASANKKSAEMSKQAIELSQKSIELSTAVLEEMKISRFQEIAPQIIVFIDKPYGKDFIMYLVVKNTGRTLAKNVKFKFIPTLMTGFGNEAHEFNVYFIKNGISSLAPNQEIRMPYDSTSNLGKYDLPLNYKLEVSYSSELDDKRIKTEHEIDLSVFDDLSWVEKKGEQDLIKAVEELANSNQGILRVLVNFLNNFKQPARRRSPKTKPIENYSRRASRLRLQLRR